MRRMMCIGVGRGTDFRKSMEREGRDRQNGHTAFLYIYSTNMWGTWFWTRRSDKSRKSLITLDESFMLDLQIIKNTSALYWGIKRP